MSNQWIKEERILKRFFISFGISLFFLIIFIISFKKIGIEDFWSYILIFSWGYLMFGIFILFCYFEEGEAKK